MHVCVMGAGVIGVTSAWHLLEQGHEVTLIDAHLHPAEGASSGNGAQLSYSYVAPLADPSVWTNWPYYLFSRNSPLTLRPTRDPNQWIWLAKFLRACNVSQVQRTTVELLRLAALSRELLSQLRQSQRLTFQHRVAGKLVMFDTASGLAMAERQVQLQKDHGCRQRVINLSRCIEIEPALASAKRGWVGGVYTEDDEVGDCAQFCRGLVELMQRRRTFRFVTSAKIIGVHIKHRKLHGVEAGRERIDADRFVLALGVGSAEFAHLAGFRLPIYPLKGYSITVPLEDESRDAAPQVSITDLASKIVYARLGNRLRVAGRVELVGMNSDIPKRCIDQLTQGVADLFPRNAIAPSSFLSPWAGFRPATPTGLPLVGPSPIEGLYLNVGHGSLGWTLASGCAALLAEQIAQVPTAIDVSAFQITHK